MYEFGGVTNRGFMRDGVGSNQAGGGSFQAMSQVVSERRRTSELRRP